MICKQLEEEVKGGVITMTNVSVGLNASVGLFSTEV